MPLLYRYSMLVIIIVILFYFVFICSVMLIERVLYLDFYLLANHCQESADGVKEDLTSREEYMSSNEWLSKFGLKSRKLEFYDVLSGICFRHCDGVIDVLEPPPADKIDLSEQQDAVYF